MLLLREVEEDGDASKLVFEIEPSENGMSVAKSSMNRNTTAAAGAVQGKMRSAGPLYSDMEKDIIKYYEKCKRRKEKQAKAEANLSANAVLNAKLAVSEPFQGDPRLEYIRVDTL